MIATENKYYYEYTEHPAVYKHAYWGNFKLYKNDSDSFRSDFVTLCYNRNRFAEQYQITKLILNPTMKLSDIVHDEIYPWRRHIEYYKCKDNSVIVIFSKYVDNDNEHDRYLSRGYELVPPLYAMNQRTYMKVFSK